MEETVLVPVIVLYEVCKLLKRARGEAGSLSDRSAPLPG